MEQWIYKRKKWWCLPHKSEENLGESSGSLCHAVDPTENSAHVSVLSSRYTGHQAVLKFAAAPRPFLLLTVSVLEISLTRSRQSSGSGDFRWLLILGPHTSLSQRPLNVNLPTTALCNSDSTLHSVGIAISSNNKGAHSVGLWRVLA